MLARLARSSYRHRRRVLAVWVVLLAFALTVGSQLAGEWKGGRFPVERS